MFYLLGLQFLLDSVSLRKSHQFVLLITKIQKILLEKIYKTGLTTMNNFEFIGLKIHNKCLSLFDWNEKKMNERWFNLALLCYFLEIL